MFRAEFLAARMKNQRIWTAWNHFEGQQLLRVSRTTVRSGFTCVFVSAPLQQMCLENSLVSKTFLSFPKENMRGNGRRRHTKENERGTEWRLKNRKERKERKLPWQTYLRKNDTKAQLKKKRFNSVWVDSVEFSIPHFSKTKMNVPGVGLLASQTLARLVFIFESFATNFPVSCKTHVRRSQAIHIDGKCGECCGQSSWSGGFLFVTSGRSWLHLFFLKKGRSVFKSLMGRAIGRK